MTAQSTYNLVRAIGFQGGLADSSHCDVTSMRNDEAASMAFGHAVKHDSLSDDSAAGILTAITGERLAGIVMKIDSYSDTQLDDVGVKAGQHLNVLQKGRIYVACEDGCNVGDPLHIRAVAGGGEIAGACRASSDGVDTIDATTIGRWRTAAAAGEIAVLEVDFSRSL